MEQRIKDRYTEEIYQQALERYGVEADQVKRLDGFESYIYEYTLEDRGYILRIGHSLRRSPGLIAGEVDWINYLANGGLSVARAVISSAGRLVETIEDGQGGVFLATAFEKAPGAPIRSDVWDHDFFQRYGRLIGRMHALSKEYRPPKPTWKRPAWNDQSVLDLAPWIPKTEPLVKDRWQELHTYLETLPEDKESYGLIHQDAHAGNFFVDGDTITLFDFDDCVYGWFAYDIAVVLFYAVMGSDDWAAFTRSFMTHFLTGYAQENELPPEWLAEIPNFLKLREIDLYAVIHRSFDVQNLDDPWVKRYMEGRRQRIETGTPYIEFDFKSLERTLAEG
ncbi:MAG: phosphotransferase [Chloroflexota bacterium]|jgi:Ser/Thr protein kinase RdoA (MazF antagonist)